MMTRILGIVLAAGFVLLPGAAGADKGGWVALFDGKSLDG